MAAAGGGGAVQIQFDNGMIPITLPLDLRPIGINYILDNPQVPVNPNRGNSISAALLQTGATTSNTIAPTFAANYQGTFTTPGGAVFEIGPQLNAGANASTYGLLFKAKLTGAPNYNYVVKFIRPRGGEIEKRDILVEGIIQHIVYLSSMYNNTIDCPYTPKVFAIYSTDMRFSVGGALEPCIAIVMENLDGCTDIDTKILTNEVRQHILHTARMLHNLQTHYNFQHADLHAKNILCVGRRTVMIDFGESRMEIGGLLLQNTTHAFHNRAYKKGRDLTQLLLFLYRQITPPHDFKALPPGTVMQIYDYMNRGPGPAYTNKIQDIFSHAAAPPFNVVLAIHKVISFFETNDNINAYPENILNRFAGYFTSAAGPLCINNDGCGIKPPRPGLVGGAAGGGGGGGGPGGMPAPAPVVPAPAPVVPAPVPVVPAPVPVVPAPVPVVPALAPAPVVPSPVPVVPAPVPVVPALAPAPFVPAPVPVVGGAFGRGGRVPTRGGLAGAHGSVPAGVTAVGGLGAVSGPILTGRGAALFPGVTGRGRGGGGAPVPAGVTGLGAVSGAHGPVPAGVTGLGAHGHVPAGVTAVGGLGAVSGARAVTAGRGGGRGRAVLTPIPSASLVTSSGLGHAGTPANQGISAAVGLGGAHGLPWWLVGGPAIPHVDPTPVPLAAPTGIHRRVRHGSPVPGGGGGPPVGAPGQGYMAAAPQLAACSVARPCGAVGCRTCASRADCLKKTACVCGALACGTCLCMYGGGYICKDLTVATTSIAIAKGCALCKNCCVEAVEKGIQCVFCGTLAVCCADKCCGCDIIDTIKRLRRNSKTRKYKARKNWNARSRKNRKA